MKDFRTTIRDELIGDCPPSQDIDLPSDGSRRWVVVALIMLAAAVALAGASYVSWALAVGAL